MFNLVFTESYEDDISKLELKAQKQIDKKVRQLEFRPLLGRKLVGYPYWSLHIGAYRVIYKINIKDKIIEIIAILERKHDYREIKSL